MFLKKLIYVFDYFYIIPIMKTAIFCTFMVLTSCTMMFPKGATKKPIFDCINIPRFFDIKIEFYSNMVILSTIEILRTNLIFFAVSITFLKLIHLVFKKYKSYFLQTMFMKIIYFFFGKYFVD